MFGQQKLQTTILTTDEFIKAARSRNLTDSNGAGFLVTENGEPTNFIIYPSDFLFSTIMINNYYSHVEWCDKPHSVYL